MKHTIIYLDDNNNLAPEDQATHAVIHVFDEEGRFVEEIYQNLKNDIKCPEDYMTEEQIQDLMKKL